MGMENKFKEKSYPYQKDCQKDPWSCNFCRSFLQTAPNSPENIKKFLEERRMEEIAARHLQELRQAAVIEVRI